ncbi:hypothetical protein PsorP6_004954 [Peronosclerospora sorghi]|uniref:Uncharacterized protein n=1 Tax=Peronosclerospora sorghi TaxID=230839 RepID=A0ACC0W4L3_9STRA|nr:hypothetical protein PsorP6_004954 [Peronosclerospora sorghi]
MSGNKNPMTTKLEELVEKAGVAKQVLDLEQVVCDDLWTEEREKLAQEHLSQDKSTIPAFWQHKYENEAAKNWDTFYKRNATNFYKDRHIYTWSLKISASSPSSRGHEDTVGGWMWRWECCTTSACESSCAAYM